MTNNDNKAFYLKYRPQTLNDLIAQESVKKILMMAYLSNKLAHAYLFAGPRGSGKTSTARILAKMVNCSAEQNVPCNKCDTCISITDGSNMDLIEIDAASNRGIEDIRSLREKIKLSPTSSKKKVYIIDEVHMLTTEAFNALLKTLEEPPKHALFILATTDAGKLPQTILSRVQRLDFKLASSEEIIQALEKIVKEEKIDIDKDGLKLLARLSEGSFRDGVKLLDQMASLGDKITATTILSTIKSSQFEDLIVILQKLAEKQVKEVLIEINKLIEGGADVKQFVLSLMDFMRNLMLIKNGVGEELVKKDYTEEDFQKLVSLSEKFNNNVLMDALESLQKAFEKLKFTSIPVLPLELAVVEICGLEELSPTSITVRNEVMKQSDEESQVSVMLEGAKRPIASIKDSIEPIESALQNDEVKIDNSLSSSDIQRLKEKWTYVLETIRPYNFSLEALLRSINIKECTETTVILEVPYSFHQRILEAPKNRDLLESILSEILGRSIKVSTVLGNRPQRSIDVANIEVAQDDEIIRVAAEIFNSDSVN